MALVLALNFTSRTEAPMAYQDHIIQMSQLIDSKKGPWAAIDAESAPGAGPDDQVEGTLADEMWSRWTTRQGLRNHPERTRASDSRRSHDVIAGPGATGDPGDQDRAGPPGTPERKR